MKNLSMHNVWYKGILSQLAWVSTHLTVAIPSINKKRIHRGRNLNQMNLVLIDAHIMYNNSCKFMDFCFETCITMLTMWDDTTYGGCGQWIIWNMLCQQWSHACGHTFTILLSPQQQWNNQWHNPVALKTPWRQTVNKKNHYLSLN